MRARERRPVRPLDLLFVGPNDLRWQMKKMNEPEPTDAEFEDMLTRVVAAGKKTSPMMAIARIVFTSRVLAPAAVVISSRLFRSQKRKPDPPSIWARNKNLTSSGRETTSIRS